MHVYTSILNTTIKVAKLATLNTRVSSSLFKLFCVSVCSLVIPILTSRYDDLWVIPFLGERVHKVLITSTRVKTLNDLTMGKNYTLSELAGKHREV